MKILIIIPAYNEEKNIVSVLKELETYKDEYDVIVINDKSIDKTSEICKLKGVRVIDLPCNLGIGGAVQTGYKYAFQNDYDIAIQLDGDGQHIPRYISMLVTPIIEEKSDFVIGSRYIDKVGFQSTFLRRIGIKYFSNLLKLLSKIKVTDPTSGFRACNKEIISLFANMYPLDYPEPESIMFLLRNNFSITEVPVIMRERSAGTSSINIHKSIYYMIKVTFAVLIDRLRLKKNKASVRMSLSNDNTY